MAVLLGDHPAQDPTGVWTVTLIHELLHMWVGSTLRRSSQDDEWFIEGVNEYVTMLTASRRGLTREDVLLRRLGTYWRRYLDGVGETSMSLAGREKSRNYYLLYGGGLHVGLLLDLELRKATSGQRRIDDLMQALYRDFGLPRQNLTTNDVERVAEETSTWTTAKIAAIRKLAAATVEFARRKLPKIYSRELVDVIFEQPYCRIANLVEAGIVERQAASRYLKALVSIGVLQEQAMGREKLFVHPRLLALLTTDTNAFPPYGRQERVGAERC